MTLGGFTSTVRITRSSFCGEYKGIVTAEMELKGKLLEFHYGNLRDRITYNTKTEVFVTINFKENQKVPFEDEDEGKPYIGTIRLIDYEKEKYDSYFDTEIRAIVNINLPIDNFYQLSLWEGKLIHFDTIHDIINPTEDQKTDHIVAFVKRVWFEITDDSMPKPEKKRWLFGIR